MQGRVFAWIDRMLSSQPVASPAAAANEWGGPPKAAVARSALTNLLQVCILPALPLWCYSPCLLLQLRSRLVLVAFVWRLLLTP